MECNYIVEFRQIGKLVKVSAMDPATLVEISIAVPAGKGISQKDMSTVAIKRLEYMIKKKQTQET